MTAHTAPRDLSAWEEAVAQIAEIRETLRNSLLVR